MSAASLAVLLILAASAQGLRSTGTTFKPDASTSDAVQASAHGRQLLQGGCTGSGSITTAGAAGAAAMATALLGSSATSGLNILGATYVGAAGASGVLTFPCGHALSSQFPNGAVVLTSGSASVTRLLSSTDGATSTSNGLSGDPALAAIVSPLSVNDASVLTISLQAQAAGQLTFKYVFASEEYPEFVGGNFNDVFLLSVNGNNVALLPSSTTPVTINNVNVGVNSQYYVANSPATKSIAYDGYTVKLTTNAVPVNAGDTITLKLAIGDVGDYSYDSAVYLEASSLTVFDSPPPPPSPSPPPPPSPSPPPPPPPPTPSPPPPAGKTYDCRSTQQYLVAAKQVASFKVSVPGNPLATDADKAVVCQQACNENPLCDGYVYKTDRTCLLKSQVTGFTTETWTTIFIACRVVTAAP